MSVETQMLRTIYKADRLATLAETLDAKGKGNPAVGKAGDAFSAQLKNNLGKIPELEAQLQKNPALAGKIEALVLKDPQAFEKAIPAILKDPNAATAEIDKASRGSAAPAAATAAAPKPAAASAPAAAQPEPAAVAAATPRAEPAPATPPKAEAPTQTAQRPAEQPAPAAVAAAPAGTGPSAGSPPGNFTGTAKTTEEKIAELQTQPGFDYLVAVVSKNEHMKQALQNGTNPNDPAGSNGLVDMVYDQVREEKAKSPPNNEYLKQTAERLERMPPGMQSTFGRIMADTPNGGKALFNMMSPMLDGDQNGMMGSLLQDGGKLSGMLQSILPFLAKVLESFMGKAKNDLQNSREPMAVESKTGITAQALAAANARPDKLTMVDRENGAETELRGEEIATGRPAPAPAYSPENRPENRPGATPGPQFQPS